MRPKLQYQLWMFDDLDTENIASFWRARGLSIRASNCLAKANIPSEEQLAERLTNFDDVLALRNCGRLTAEEIWRFIQNLEPESPKPDSQFAYEHLSPPVKNATQLWEAHRNEPTSILPEELNNDDSFLQTDEKEDNICLGAETTEALFEEGQFDKETEDDFWLDSADELDEMETSPTQEGYPRAAIDTYQMWFRLIQRIQPQVKSADNQFTTKRLSADEEAELFHRLEIAKRKVTALLDQFPSWILEPLSLDNSSQQHDEGARNSHLLLENFLNSIKPLEQIREAIDAAPANGGNLYQNHETTKIKQLWEDLSAIIEQIQEIKHKIIESNLRLVLNIATQCSCRNMEKMDLVQEGHIGLMKAIDRFDVHKGHRFSTYATWWIRQAVWRARDNNACIIRLPNYMIEKRSKFLQGISQLSQKLQRAPTTDEIAGDLEFSVNQVDDFFNHPTSDLRLGQRFIPQTLLEYRDWWDAIDAEDVLQDEMQTWHTPSGLRFLSEVSEFGEIRDYRQEIASVLPPEERRHLEEPLGWNDGAPKPDVEIGAVLGFVRERERQRWLGCEPTLEEICNAVGVPSSIADEIQQVVSEPLALDQPIKSDTLAELVLRLSQVCCPESPPELLINESQGSPEEEFQSRLNKEALDQILETLSHREMLVIKLRFGLNDGTEYTLAEIGRQLGTSRERIRQIEKAALEKLHHPMRMRLLKELLQTRVCPLERPVTRTPDLLAPKSRTADKPTRTTDKPGKSDSGDQDGFAELVMKLQRYGYRPLTLEECCQPQQKPDESQRDPDQLLDTITNHAEFKVYQYGRTYIGLKAWTWFNPEKATTSRGKADLVEWFFRMTNEPATAKTVADGIWGELGNFRITPFEVADVCEKQSHRFQADEDDRYALSLWQDATTYRSNLEQLLADGSLPIEQIVERLSAPGSDQTDCIIAALNRYHEVFVEIAPFEWALKSDASQDTEFDFENLMFEDLIPK